MGKRGTILNLYRDTVVHRWLAHLGFTYNGRPLRYCLKDYNGGTDPTADYCHSVDPQKRASADCIGFILHGAGIDRKQPGYDGALGEWLNCTSLLADAKGEQKFCRLLRMGEVPQAGDWLLNKSHIGGVLRDATKVSEILVIDCSPRHGRETAIGIGGPWAKDCVVVRPKFYKENQ